MTDSITLSQALDIMDAGHPFSIAFVTADARRNKGGEWVEVDKAYKSGYVDKGERQAPPESSNIIRRHPQHYINSTRNIFIARNSEIRKVHIRLIRRFNGKVVL